MGLRGFRARVFGAKKTLPLWKANRRQCGNHMIQKASITDWSRLPFSSNLYRFGLEFAQVMLHRFFKGYL